LLSAFSFVVVEITIIVLIKNKNTLNFIIALVFVLAPIYRVSFVVQLLGLLVTYFTLVALFPKHDDIPVLDPTTGNSSQLSFEMAATLS
jgi:hypothetical protein